MKTLLMLCCFYSFSALAVVNLKLAVLVPEGTTWGDSLKKFSREVDTATKGEVALRFPLCGALWQLVAAVNPRHYQM